MPDEVPIPTDRETLLEREHEALARWQAATANVPPDAIREDGWTFKDTVAHIGAWQRRTAARLRALDLGEPDLVPVEADEFNARVLEEWRDRPWDEVTREAEEARADFIDAVETVRPETLVANDGLGAWIVAHNGHLHYEEHLEDEWRTSWRSRAAIRLPIASARLASRRGGGAGAPLDWHWIDFVIIGFIAWTTFVAFARGLIQELVTVIGVIGGALLAGRFYGDLSANLSFVMDAGATRDFVAFGAIFLGIVVVGQVLSMLLKGAASILMLGAFDHLGGAVFGFVKGLLLVEVALIAVTTFPISESATAAVRESALAPFFLDAVPVVLGLLPDEFADAVEALPLIPTELPNLPGSLPGGGS